jgi:hypothetical protein
MAVNDVLESVSVCFGFNQNALNVAHWRVQSVGGTEPTLAEKLASISTLLRGSLKAAISASWTFNGFKGRVIRPVAGALIQDLTGAGAGTLAGDPLPPQISGVISVRSAFAPARTRGRIYLPSATEAENTTTGIPSAAYITTMTTFANLFTVDLNVAGAGGATCVLRPVLMKKTIPVNDYQITQVIVRGFWGTQRRRSRINRNDAPAL